MATNAVKLAQRTSNRTILNKILHYSNRTLSNIGKWNIHSSSIPAITLNMNRNHICSNTCCHKLMPNTLNYRSMSTTQDKNNDDNDQNEKEEIEEQEEEEEEGESEESDNEQSSSSQQASTTNENANNDQEKSGNFFKRMFSSPFKDKNSKKETVFSVGTKDNEFETQTIYESQIDDDFEYEQVMELQNKIADLEKEVTKYKEALARSHADIINIQNMSKKDVESAKKFAIKGFSKDMLNVADSLDGCINVVEQHLNDYKHDDNKLDENIKSVIEGVKITQGTLIDTFGRHGINKIESLHQEFDPNYHEALFKQPTNEHPEDHVIQVISEGYTIKDAVLRAAKVGVSAVDTNANKDDQQE